MFRCDSCGSGYSARAATWESCPRCYAKEGANVPLTFEIGWRSPRAADTRAKDARPGVRAPATALEADAARPAAMT